MTASDAITVRLEEISAAVAFLATLLKDGTSVSAGGSTTR